MEKIAEVQIAAGLFFGELLTGCAGNWSPSDLEKSPQASSRPEPVDSSSNAVTFS
jgi:hypothetical protein